MLKDIIFKRIGPNVSTLVKTFRKTLYLTKSLYEGSKIGSNTFENIVFQHERV